MVKQGGRTFTLSSEITSVHCHTIIYFLKYTEFISYFVNNFSITYRVHTCILLFMALQFFFGF